MADTIDFVAEDEAPQIDFQPEPEVTPKPRSNIFPKAVSKVAGKVLPFGVGELGKQVVSPESWTDKSLLGISPEIVPSGAGTSMPGVTIPLSAVGKTAAGLGQFATSPKGISEMAVAATPAAPLMFAKWAYDMLKGGVTSVSNIGQELRDMITDAVAKGTVNANQLGPVAPGTSPEEHIQTIADNAVNAAVSFLGGGAAGLHAIKGIPKVTAATYTDPKTGETTTAPNHIEAAAEQGVEAPKPRDERNTPEYGFEVQDTATGKTEVVSRDKAEEVARESGQLKEEPKGEKVHSDEIDLAPAKPTEAVASPTVAASTPKSGETEGLTGQRLDDVIQMLEDSIATKKANGDKVPQQYIDRLGSLKAKKRGETPEPTALFSDETVPGHPLNSDNPVLPIKISIAEESLKSIERRSKDAQDRIESARIKLRTAKGGNKPELELEIDNMKAAQKELGRLHREIERRLKEAPPPPPQVAKGTEVVPAKSGEVPTVYEQTKTREVAKPLSETKTGRSRAGTISAADVQRLSVSADTARELRDTQVRDSSAWKKADSKYRTAYKKWLQAAHDLESQPPTTPPSTGEGMAGGPGIVGMGGAVPSEFEVSPQTPTGIKNATVDVERAKRGLPPAIQPIKRSFGEVWDRAMAMIDHDPSVQDRLIDSLRQKPRALTDVEDAMLLHRQVDLQNEYGKATRDLAQAYDDGRTDAVAEEKLRVARLSDNLLDLYNIGKKVGTETGRGLNARKMMANEDFTLAKMELEKRLANNGKPLSDAQRAEIQSLHDKINATQKAYDDYVASTNERIAKLEIDKVIAEQKSATAPSFDKRILAQAEKIVQGMEKFAQPAADRLRARLANLGTSPDPAIIYDAAVVGSAKIARLGLDLAKFTDDMIRDFGEKLRPMIPQIWTEANKMLESNLAKEPELVKRAVKKQDVAEVKTAVTEKIADKVKRGKLDEVTWYVQKLARVFVQSGIRDREQLIDAVHDTIKDVIPGITRRKTMDAISGYGDYKQLSKDQITVALRGMKGEMQQLAKLEDMAKGQPPLKSGLERRTPTEAERKLIKEVNDAKNKFQVPVQDPSIQLKSALDTLKTTLTNRIKDYQDRIARGDYAKRPRRELILDKKASELKAENERVKKLFQRGVALDRLKNAGKVERAGDWVVKWRRGFILSGPITLGKLTTAALQRMAFTPAEELIGGGIGKVIPEVAKKAPREGGLNVRAEAKAISQGITQGMVDAWKTLKTGQSDLDVLYGKEALLAPTAIDFFGHVHGALKAPVKRAEFARSLEKRTQYAIANGVDLSDPLVQSRLVIDSYKDANRAIFQQDNRVITAYKRALQSLEAKDKATGEVPLGGKVLSTTARVLLPIVKIPTNIVAETMQYATGLVTGSARLARAYSRGIENLKPEEADLIMRQLKKGSLGGAVLALGYFNPQVIGGYYQPGERRPKGTPKAGTIQLYGENIPSWAIHNPLLETLQIGATIRRVADSKLRKRDTENQGLGNGIAAGLIGLGEEVPFVRETSEISKALNPHERGAFMGELGKSLLIPQFLQTLAKWHDPLKEPQKRKPQTAFQHIEMGIPGLRERVPVKAPGSTYYMPP